MSTPEPTVVHVLRHGAVDNPTGVLYGRLPGFHLSELGREMAQTVADHLAGHDIVAVVSSPLERAVETAGPVAAALGLSVQIDERLVEAGNCFQGTVVGAGAGILRHPELWHRLVNPFRPSWGEPYAQIAARMTAAIQDARDAARGREALVVSHQLPVWMARCSLEGRRLWHDPRRRECRLASLTSFTYQGERLVEIDYREPAAALLSRASKRAGA
jgi:broad specificity phosphatase PhoE